MELGNIVTRLRGKLPSWHKKKEPPIEVEYDSENGIWWMHDTRKKSVGVVEFGDIIVDLDRNGSICAVEILNANRLNVEVKPNQSRERMIRNEKK